MPLSHPTLWNGGMAMVLQENGLIKRNAADIWWFVWTVGWEFGAEVVCRTDNYFSNFIADAVYYFPYYAVVRWVKL